MKHLWLLAGLVLTALNGYAQSFAEFQREYEFHSYLLREAYPEEAFRVLTQLQQREQLSAGQQDSVHYGLGKYYYQRQELLASAEAFAKVGTAQNEMWREATFFRAFALAYTRQPGVGRQVLDEVTFTEPMYQELKSFEQAGMSLLLRDYEGYRHYSEDFTGTYFAFAEEEKNMARWAHDLETFKPKSPLLAGTLSALLPGMGRVYAGKWGQGIATLMQVALFGLQAWEGYRLDGPTSWRFITYSTIGGIFYVSNIVGSAYAAKQHNEEFYEALDYRLRVDLHVPLRTLYQ